MLYPVVQFAELSCTVVCVDVQSDVKLLTPVSTGESTGESINEDNDTVFPFEMLNVLSFSLNDNVWESVSEVKNVELTSENLVAIE